MLADKAGVWIASLAVLMSGLVAASYLSNQVVPAAPAGVDLLDDNGDGRAEYVLAHAPYTAARASDASVVATLRAGDATVATGEGNVFVRRGGNTITAAFPASSVQEALQAGDVEATVAINGEAPQRVPLMVRENQLAPWSGSARLLSAAGAGTVDADGDGLFDALLVDVSIEGVKEGKYVLSAELVGPTVTDGLQTAVRPPFVPQDRTFLSGEPRFVEVREGVQTVRVSLDGRDLYASGLARGAQVQFTLAVDRISLEASFFSLFGGGTNRPSIAGPHVIVGGRETPRTLTYRTNDLAWNRFEPPVFPAEFTGQFRHTAVDQDGNGLSDRLVLEAEIRGQRGQYDVSAAVTPLDTRTIAVEKPTAGNAQAGAYVGYAIHCNGAHWVTMTVDGGQMRALASDGPFSALFRIVATEVYRDPTATYTIGGLRSADFEDTRSGPAMAVAAESADGGTTATLDFGGEQGTVLLRLIHGNGAVVAQTVVTGDGTLAVDLGAPIAGDYVVSVYLQGGGVYRETAVTVG